jgi:hypothetical protein
MICGTPSVRSREGCLAGRSWFGLACDDLRIVGLKLIFLVVTRAVSVLGLSWREAWWKEAGILVLRHQLAVAPRERVRAENPVMAAGLVFGGDRVSRLAARAPPVPALSVLMPLRLASVRSAVYSGRPG